jgi:hypothetical protein
MSRPADDAPDRIAIPKAREAGAVEILLWVFLMSFALDYRAPLPRVDGDGAGLDQLVFLGLCVSSSFAILWLGRRFLTVRPVGWLLGFWGLFLAGTLANALLQGVTPGRAIRVALPLVFCWFGIANAHVAGCMGIRPARIVRPVFVAACINVVWRIGYGFLFQGASIETVRFEVQSPANGWLAAWIGCAILLSGRFRWGLVAACGALFLGMLITVTRSLLFPIMASALACGLCYIIGVHWGNYKWPGLWRRLLPVGAVTLLCAFALAAAAIIEPVTLERWNERLFHHSDTLNLSADISYLTRRSEADAIWRILRDDPIHFIHGRGLGSTYHWDSSYFPEIWKVIPKDQIQTEDVWSAGHSVWTYGLLSGGVIGVAAYLVLLGSTGALSLLSARANSTDPGPDQWLAFLPFVATCCLLSETLTANPFQERLTGFSSA